MSHSCLTSAPCLILWKTEATTILTQGDFVELRQPPEPDALCAFNGSDLYIEVGHIYGAVSDAKRLLGREGHVSPTKEHEISARLTPLNARLLNPLNSLLKKKASKIYIRKNSETDVWLLIRSAFPLWNQSNFEEYREQIHIPDSHKFEQIWLLCGPRASFGLLRLA